jgi:hypothetical protein
VAQAAVDGEASRCASSAMLRTTTTSRSMTTRRSGHSDNYGSVLTAHPGKSQGRPNKNHELAAQQSQRTAQPSPPRAPLRNAADATPATGRDSEPIGEISSPTTASVIKRDSPTDPGRIREERKLQSETPTPCPSNRVSCQAHSPRKRFVARPGLQPHHPSRGGPGVQESVPDR